MHERHPPLIIPRLQPGVRCGARAETVSTVSVCASAAKAKTLKRFGTVARPTPRLKPGANEWPPHCRRSTHGIDPARASCFAGLLRLVFDLVIVLMCGHAP